MKTLKNLVLMFSLVALVATMAMIEGCSENESLVESLIENTKSEYPRAEQTIIEDLALGIENDSIQKNGQVSLAASWRATYAYGVIPWYDRNNGDTDWMVVFYLPYNPGYVYFQGKTWPRAWITFNGQVQLYDARWTSRGFRVMILMGNKIRYRCGTSPSRYRLLY